MEWNESLPPWVRAYLEKLSKLPDDDPDLSTLDAGGRALWELFRPAGGEIHWPWKDLERLVGPMLPRDLIVIGGRTGGGKTTVGLNLLDHFVERGQQVEYLGLERDEDILRRVWAAHRLRFPPKLVLRRQWGELPDGAREAVAEDIRWQMGKTIRKLVRFSPSRFIDRAELGRIVRQCGEREVSLVIVDHVHHMRHGGGRDLFAEFSATIQESKELARDHNLVILMFAQFKRLGRRSLVERLYQPPDLEDIQGGGTIEQVADLILGLAPVAIASLSKADLAEVKAGKKKPVELLEPNRLRLWALKHRLDGSAVGRSTDLRIEDGQLTQYAPDWRLPIPPSSNLPEDRGDAWEPPKPWTPGND